MSKCLLFLLCNIQDLPICLCQSSIQITFDNSPQFAAASRIDGVTCADQSAHRTVTLEEKQKSLSSSQLVAHATLRAETRFIGSIFRSCLLLSLLSLLTRCRGAGPALQMLGGHGDISCDGHPAVARCRVHGHLSDHSCTRSDRGTEAHLDFLHLPGQPLKQIRLSGLFFIFFYSNALRLSKLVEACILLMDL